MWWIDFKGEHSNTAHTLQLIAHHHALIYDDPEHNVPPAPPYVTLTDLAKRVNCCRGEGEDADPTVCFPGAKVWRQH